MAMVGVWVFLNGAEEDNYEAIRLLGRWGKGCIGVIICSRALGYVGFKVRTRIDFRIALLFRRF